ncbi:uncharacterized protein LOC108734906 [Agrilus planipennis]|uniref:Uncharacterized protein LOC108734906 n=1 Tax=Agrilus planipennis TaxID=224129 RepID=A0A1W4WE10_AGRPL|nr:uncharacterized protein LOC108734906 [Agrilus planipennis]
MTTTMNFFQAFGYFVSFAVLLSYFGVSSLKDIRISVPVAVQRGERAILQCQYDLEGDPLYTVKWYKSEREFFRYAPKEKPPYKYFKLPEHKLVEKYCNATQIVFDNVSMAVAGLYSCEISLDEPSFFTDVRSGVLKVVEVPQSEPLIVGVKKRYRQGDVVKADCISRNSWPAVNLTWYLNDRPVHISHLKIHKPHNSTEGLVSAKLGLRMLITEQLFSRERLKIRCVASMYTVYYRSCEKSIEMEKRRPPTYRTTTTTEFPWIEPPPEKYPHTTLVLAPSTKNDKSSHSSCNRWLLTVLVVKTIVGLYSQR